ncbi:hypothetical protein [Salinirarus marinus]|uniref:hypothetical protein n=1 Tax=Salinirarus marinus TaxID=3068310 RepID=UPI003C6CA379
MPASENHCTITVRNEDKQLLDDASVALFGTEDVPYRVTIERLIEENDAFISKN